MNKFLKWFWFAWILIAGFTIGYLVVTAAGSEIKEIQWVATVTSDSYGVPDVHKLYDPHANVVCYVTEKSGYTGRDISCVNLN